MSLFAVGGIGLAVIFILIFLRMPIGLVFITAGFCGIWYLKGFEGALSAIAKIPFTTTMGYIWSTLPMFLLLGYVAEKSRVIEEAYDGIRRWIGHYRGGLAHSVILGNAAYGAVSGSGIAAALTFTVVSLPEMRKYGYADTLTLGAIAAGNILASLIPPSIPLIVYGGITETSVGKLFMAGLFPGLLLTALYMGVVYIQCLINPKLGPISTKTSWKEKLMAAPGLWVVAVTFLVLLGGLYMGIFTPTEGGAAAAFLILVLGLTRRRLNWQGFKDSVLGAARSTGMLFFLVIGVSVFNLFLVLTGVSRSVADLLLGFSTSPTVNMLILAAVYLFLGTFMDALAVMLVTLPTVFTALLSIGADPLTIGVLVVLTCTTGGLTPPYGMTIFAMAGMVKDVPLYQLFKGVAPFLFAIVICTLIIIYLPQLTTWLPGMMIQ